MTKPGRGRLPELRSPGLAHVHQAAILAGSAAVTLVLGLLFLGRESVWLDEGFSIAAARLPWGELVALIGDSQANMSLYYVLLHVWLTLGESEFAVRALSVLFAAAAPPTLYLLVRRLFDGRTAVIAAALLAINAYFLRYAQEARGYALLVFLVTLATYLLVVAVEGRARTGAASYVLVAALATYVHVFAGFVVIAHALAVSSRPDVPRRWLLSVLGLWALLVAPLALVLLRQDSGQIDWITTPGPTDVVAALAKLAGGHFSAVAYIFLCSAALVAIRRRVAKYGRWPLSLVSAWLATPLVLSLAASAVKPIFLAVYLIVSLPALVTLASVGLASLPRGPAALAAVVLCVALFTVDLAAGYDSENESWRAATSHVLAASQPGDRIGFYAPYTRIPFEYYRRRASATGISPSPVYPPDRWGRLALDADNLAGTPLAAAGAVAGGTRVWVVVSHAEDGEIDQLNRALEPRGRLLSVRSFTGVDVRLYQLGRP